MNSERRAWLHVVAFSFNRPPSLAGHTSLLVLPFFIWAKGGLRPSTEVHTTALQFEGEEGEIGASLLLLSLAATEE